MERIRRFFRRLGKGLKAKGYTLVEIAAVVAVTGTLSAVVIPIAVDKVKQGKEASAKNDCIQIGVAITGFYKDVGEWPAYGPTNVDKNYYYVLRSGKETGVLNASTATHDPKSASILWGGYVADILENHLVKDNPGGAADAYTNAYKNIHTLNWKGPYSESLNKRDPWGNNYLVWIKGMHTPSGGGNDYVLGNLSGWVAKEYGWIISAGPNGFLDTEETANSLGKDDIGVMLYAPDRGR